MPVDQLRGSGNVCSNRSSRSFDGSSPAGGHRRRALVPRRTLELLLLLPVLLTRHRWPAVLAPAAVAVCAAAVGSAPVAVGAQARG